MIAVERFSLYWKQHKKEIGKLHIERVIYFCTSESLNTAHLTPFLDNTISI